MRISVEKPILRINHSNTFMVTDLAGQIQSNGHFGIFSDDTRFLSYYACYIDGHAWERLTSTATTYYAARIHLTNPEFISKDGLIPSGTLSFVISRTAQEGIHEDLNLTNYGLLPIRFNLEIALRSDFADIFEVESRQFVRRGRIETRWDEERNELSTTYTNEDFFRRLIYKINKSSCPPHSANGRITFELELQPGESWHACCGYTLAGNEHKREPANLCYEAMVDGNITDGGVETLHHKWLNNVTDINSCNEAVNRLYRQSVEDLGSLRLFDYDFEPDIWLPAAGVPKFVTLFGRDSLIVSLQTTISRANFARGTLKKLAQWQATERDDWRDAEPGKILHEVRSGELAYLKQVPHTPYYGTADATPLFLILLHETWKWLGDESLLQEHRDVALRCLEWIERYGDRDGDGFQEYQTKSARGIGNQGWKDSGDAIVYPDGSQVETPIALCELQGYVFDATMRMAEVFEALGEADRATTLRAKGATLQKRFEEKFWCEDLGCYAFALDSDKQPVRSVASNTGHCLWSGIARPDRAASVVQRLLKPDMWTGWGIRTLSSQNPAYNPFSYHRGSVWPHDNSIIALGFKRYGFALEAALLAHGIFDAGTYFASDRLPELYAGIECRPGAIPVPYLEANVPQAWAAGSVFQLLQSMLGLSADAPQGYLYVDPYLPDWLSDITLSGLEIGNASIDLKFWRLGDRTCWDARVTSGEIEVKAKPWQPWSV